MMFWLFRMNRNIAVAEEVLMPVAPVVVNDISIGDIFSKAHQYKKLVLFITLFAALIVLSFHYFKKSFVVATEVRYPISLTFLNSSNTYPNGTIFSPNDIVATDIISQVVAKKKLSIKTAEFKKSIYISHAYKSLAHDEQKFSEKLKTISTPADIHQISNVDIQAIGAKARASLYINVNASSLDLSVSEAEQLAKEIIDTWASDAITSGLMNAAINRPVKEFTLNKHTDLLDFYDYAELYLTGLEQAVASIGGLSGSSSLIVDGFTLSDVRQELEQLAHTNIRPLRKYAYANSDVLTSESERAQVRFVSKKRLLGLEHERLEKLILSYDLILGMINTGAARDMAGANIGHIGGAQVDGSFLSSVLEIGGKLSGNEQRNKIHELREQAVIALLAIEKEISILEVADSLDLQVKEVLQTELDGIASALNILQSKITLLIDANRLQVLQNNNRLYLSDEGVVVDSGMAQLIYKIAIYTLIGLVIGFMAGLVVAIVLALGSSKRILDKR